MRSAWRFLRSSVHALQFFGAAVFLTATPPVAHAGHPRNVTHQQGATRVWINPSSRVYHCPGSRYYGATKRGSYATEADARAKGNRPAQGKACGPVHEPTGPVRPLGDFGSGNDVQVWVNTSSGVYHCPGSPYFRNTKRGQLMTEHEAKASGKRPAYGKTCGS